MTVCAVVGVAGCGGDSDEAKKELTKAQAQARKELSNARAQIEQEKDAAKDELSTTQDELSEARQKLKAERSRLRRLQEQVSGAQATIAENTIPGEGTFEVGKDIEPGTYRADASPGCYWARLSSLDTSDIIDNDNADGPVVVQVLPSDRALQVSDCADFHKSG